jgi:hypothetical protein
MYHQNLLMYLGGAFRGGDWCRFRSACAIAAILWNNELIAYKSRISDKEVGIFMGAAGKPAYHVIV